MPPPRVYLTSPLICVNSAYPVASPPVTATPPSPVHPQSTEIEACRRASTRSSADAEQATTLLETARAEVRLTGERADDAVAAVARVTREGATALEETRRMYEDRAEASRMDCDARAKAAEDRARAVEHERQRAEAARQAASKELARLQVGLVYFLFGSDRRVGGEWGGGGKGAGGWGWGVGNYSHSIPGLDRS